MVACDEQAITAAVRDYFDAGATEVIFTQTNLLGEDARLRTWRLLGELARSHERGSSARLLASGGDGGIGRVSSGHQPETKPGPAGINCSAGPRKVTGGSGE